MATEFRKVWISKYALTRGVYEEEVHVQRDGEARDRGCRTYFAKGDWWETKEEALLKADAMRRAKIATLKNQVTKLEAMTFKEEPK
jgi:hypothetical protein